MFTVVGLHKEEQPGSQKPEERFFLPSIDYCPLATSVGAHTSWSTTEVLVAKPKKTEGEAHEPTRVHGAGGSVVVVCRRCCFLVLFLPPNWNYHGSSRPALLPCRGRAGGLFAPTAGVFRCRPMVAVLVTLW